MAGEKEKRGKIVFIFYFFPSLSLLVQDNIYIQIQSCGRCVRCAYEIFCLRFLSASVFKPNAI